MATCFVIQPFDGGAFDKRYADVLKPAIEDANLEPYRVDEDPGSSILIDDIHKGINDASVCLADISSDNANVWFELGYAIASRKEVILVCGQSRTRFPFDVQHRTIIRYQTESPQDFEILRQEITSRLKAALRKEQRLEQVRSPMADVAGLSQHEIVALVSLAENLDSPSHLVAAHQIRADMERAGYKRVAVYVAMASLTNKGLVIDEEESDNFGNGYMVYRLTSQGSQWLLDNQDKLLLWEEPKNEAPAGYSHEDDIPF